MSAATERRANLDRALEHRGIDPQAGLSLYQLKELIRVVQIYGCRLRVVAATLVGHAEIDTAATYDTDPDQGANAAIVYTAGAAAPGELGNNLRIAYANTATAGSETVTYGVTKAGVVTVTVGIQSGVSTANQVLTALTTDAGSYLSHALKSGNDGSGVVVTMTAKALTGGEAPTGAFAITPDA